MLSSTESMKKFESTAQNLVDQKLSTQMVTLTEGAQLLEQYKMVLFIRVAELGSLSSGAKMAMKIVVKRVFTIFASNASFLRVIAYLQN